MAQYVAIILLCLAFKNYFVATLPVLCKSCFCFRYKFNKAMAIESHILSLASYGWLKVALQVSASDIQS